MAITDDLVRLAAIEAEATRLAEEAKTIPPGAPPLELARLSAIEDALAMLLAEARTLHARVMPALDAATAKLADPPKKKRRRWFSLRGSGLAVWSIVTTVGGIFPMATLLVVLALFYHLHAFKLGDVW